MKNKLENVNLNEKQNRKSLKRDKICRKATSKSSLEKREKIFTHRRIYKEKKPMLIQRG